MSKITTFFILSVFTILFTACSSDSANTKITDSHTGSSSPTSTNTTVVAIPGRPDNLTQIIVDQLLANAQMNFDGMRFDNKRFDFINFDLGSFRGTTFNNSILNDGVARRKFSEPDKFDFENANIYMSKLKRVNFYFYKFTRTTFLGDSITDGSFKYCPFTDVKLNACTIYKVKFNNGYKSNYTNVQFYNCKFNGGGFDSLKLISSAFSMSTAFIDFKFNNVELNSTTFLPVSPNSPVSFNGGCRFNKVKFASCLLDGVIFGQTLSHTGFEDVTFDNTTIRNVSLNGDFFGACKFIGSEATIQRVNFGASVFNGGTFGVENSSYKLLLQDCKFDNCTFNAAVTFYNCDLSKTTFPSIAILQAAGVKFKNCVFAPYNS